MENCNAKPYKYNRFKMAIKAQRKDSIIGNKINKKY